MRATISLAIAVSLLSGSGMSGAHQASEPEPTRDERVLLLEDGARLEFQWAPSPDWFTSEVAAATRAASARGLAFDPSSGRMVELSAGAISPGVSMVDPLGCTMSFVFGTEGDYFMSTAGHCVGWGHHNPNDVLGSEVTVRTWDGDTVALGTVSSYEFNYGDKWGQPWRDWALIDVYDSVQEYVDPTVPEVGGPQCGAYEGVPLPDGEGAVYAPYPAKYFSYRQTGTYPLSRERPGVIVPGYPETVPMYGGPKTVAYTIATYPGDSGGPVIVDTPQPDGGPGTCPFGQALAITTAALTGFPFSYGTPVNSFPHPPLAEDPRAQSPPHPAGAAMVQAIAKPENLSYFLPYCTDDEVHDVEGSVSGTMIAQGDTTPVDGQISWTGTITSCSGQTASGVVEDFTITPNDPDGFSFEPGALVATFERDVQSPSLGHGALWDLVLEVSGECRHGSSRGPCTLSFEGEWVPIVRPLCPGCVATEALVTGVVDTLKRRSAS